MNEIKAVFDIGNDSIKAVVFANDNGKETILAKQIESSFWLKKGKILDAERFTTTINKIVENFSKKLGGDFIENVVISLSHPEMIISRIYESKRILQEEVTEDDADHLSRIIDDISGKDNYETLKILPVCRIIDEEKREKDPVGLKCKKLELVADVFMIPKNFHTGLTDAFDKVGLNIIDIIPNIMATPEICIDYDHKDLGTILIDIGKNQTSYVVYEEGYAVAYGTIPLGWEDVTKDISIWMQVDIKDAEEIKRTLGTALITEDIMTDTEMDIAFLSEIINARYEEIFNKIITRLQKIDKDWRLPGGVLLVGGGSKMNNLDLLAKVLFRLSASYAKDITMNIWDLGNNSQFINLLAAYYRSNKYMDIDSRKISFKPGKFIGKITDFFKSLV